MDWLDPNRRKHPMEPQTDDQHEDESYHDRMDRLKIEHPPAWRFYTRHYTLPKTWWQRNWSYFTAIFTVLLVGGITTAYMLTHPVPPQDHLVNTPSSTVLMHYDMMSIQSTQSPWLTNETNEISGLDKNGNVDIHMDLGAFPQMSTEDITSYRPLQEACFAVHAAIWQDESVVAVYPVQELRLTVQYTRPDHHIVEGGCTLTRSQAQVLDWVHETATDMWKHRYYTAYLMPPDQ